ncbi:MFS transporter [Fluviicola sp.]|uniref:MFS transporter n=1 Tax=Fluviicola sp. TaxID=1917219 RepID=UPI002626D18E|nr:MFS transporter [Fluviicola sp.]
MSANKHYFLEQSSVLNSMLFLERFTYYGLQTFTYSYLISEAMNLYGDDATQLLLTFSSALLFARVFGGLMVDFLFGTKISIIVSCGLQILGIVLFMQKQLGLFYLGMFVFLVGQSLFSPAIMKSVGMLYSGRKHKMDGALNFNFFAINLGSFLAPLAFFYLGLSTTFERGFTSCIICLLIIAGLSFLIKKTNPDSEFHSEISDTGSNRINETIFLSIFGLFLYWLFRQLLTRSMDNFNYSGFRSGSVDRLVALIPTLIPLVGYLIFGIIWNRFKFSPLLKVVIGFGAAIISIFAAIMTMTNSQTDNPAFMTSFIALNFIGEILLFPTLLSFILQFSPQRFMATFSGLALSAFGFLSFYIGNKLFDNIGDGNYRIMTLVSGGGFFFCMLAALILFLLTKKKDVSHNHLDEF